MTMRNRKAGKEQAKILKLQRVAMEEARAEELPWYAQPSVRAAIRNAARKRMTRN